MSCKYQNMLGKVGEGSHSTIIHIQYWDYLF